MSYLAVVECHFDLFIWVVNCNNVEMSGIRCLRLLLSFCGSDC